MARFRTLDEIDARGKRVLVRVDLNVPVKDGKVTRQSPIRLVRDSVVIYTGKLSSLKRFKDDAREVLQGYECGLTIDGYNDVKVGDVIEAYDIVEEAPTL